MTSRSLLAIPLAGAGRGLPLGGQVEDLQVTLLDPFADPATLDSGALAELRRYFADVVPFVVRLTGVSRLPGGALYLTPEPVATLQHLTTGLLRRFPELPRGRVDAAVPRVTLPDLPLGDGPAHAEDPDALQARLAPWLPLTGHARLAQVLVHEDGPQDRPGTGVVRTVASFGFGASAA